jgi:hypothetical protein
MKLNVSFKSTQILKICKTITPSVNFINVLRLHFFVQNFGAKNSEAVFLPNVTRKKLLRLFYEKGARKMLMKLTPYKALEIE